MYSKIVIDAKKSANAIFRHPWIFSGAIIKKDREVQHGCLVQIEDPEGRILGTGTFSASSSIAVRILDFFGKEINQQWFVERLREAKEKRRLMDFGPDTETTGYRLVFGEADGLPGLIIDRFGEVFVLQIATAGMAALRGEIVVAIKEVFNPKSIYERSDIVTRREESLPDETGLLFGDEIEKVEFEENGMKFLADIIGGQKTGFFLDQRDTRAAIRSLAAGRKVLNIFSYSGAASVAALLGGAKFVTSVDSSAKALSLIAENMKLNKISNSKFSCEEADAFAWLGTHNEPRYDMVIIDPPALIKSRHDIEEGKKAYHFLNRAAMRLIKNGGIFVTSSCSHYLSEEDLAFILRRASVQNKIDLSILKIIHQAPDHPRSVYFSEAMYLKTFVCLVER
jgi:23S rRNA (cytosine1962-C5)-methyltransferase